MIRQLNKDDKRTFHIYEVEFRKNEDASKARLNLIGQLEYAELSGLLYSGQLAYEDTKIVAFYLDQERNYGMFLNSGNIIVYFEYGSSPHWIQRTGTNNKKAVELNN